MHLLNPAPFGRILPAMVTPMKADGTVDFEAAQSLAKQLVADGADGLVVNGTTGESPVTHMEEKVELVRAVKEVVDVPVISGAGSNDTAHTVRMVEQTQEAGADAVLVVMPYYSRPSQDGVVGHYKAVDSVAERPIIVYDVPGRTGLKVRVETYDRLAELEHVKAVKDATGDLAAAVEKQHLAIGGALQPVHAGNAVADGQNGADLLRHGLRRPREHRLFQQRDDVALRGGELFERVLELAQASARAPVVDLCAHLEAETAGVVITLLPGKRRALAVLFGEEGQKSLLLLLRRTRGREQYGL